jgi:hypothetical protein
VPQHSAGRTLLRNDLWRLAKGMKAEIVLLDLKSVLMMPARDPLGSLIYTAADREWTASRMAGPAARNLHYNSR